MMKSKVLSLVGSLVLVTSVACGDDDGNGSPDASPGVDADTSPDADNGADAGTDAGEPSLQEIYLTAIDDAEIAEASEVVDTLTAINEDNTDLVRDAEGRVLMVTWTSYPGYDELIGEETMLAVEVWTTVAPEAKELCQATGLQGPDLALRLEQLLGLPPGDGKDRMVEMWVEPASMFRPSPDPEITDSVAELDYPENTPQEHIDWIEALKASSYGMNGYPWTRLGYTYDWSPEATTEVGLSEFVVSQGATVKIESVTATDTYCKPAE